MSPIVVEPLRVGDVVGMGVVDEVLYLLTVFLVILGFVLVVDFSFDVEEAGGAVVSSPLAAVALESMSASCYDRGSCR
jgi:hypothetical protein